uniref:Uncharacterized protein n=1 Tax=Nothobranchius furzeri TaxID=105023 RepID=A0A8C6NXQ2_NOTFU
MSLNRCAAREAGGCWTGFNLLDLCVPPGGCLASELSFLFEPSDVIAVRDRLLMLDCQVQGAQPITVTWRKNGLPLPTSPRVQVLENGTLLIQRFQKRKEGSDADTGEYDCTAQNRYGLLVSRKARIQLASLPKFHTHPGSMSVDEGGVARFQCQINGVPEARISWEKDRVALNTSDSRYTLLPMGILQVTGVKQVDAGVFRCVASNIANTRYSQEARLNVTGGAPKTYKEPFILSGPQNLTITVHQTAILECIATGNPRPIVSWSRLDGRSIGVEGIQVLGTGNLMISDVSLQHSGVYVCAANRPGTRMRRTALGRLVVQGEASIVAQQNRSETGGFNVIMRICFINHVLSNRYKSEIQPDSMELQEAISRDAFQHDVTNLEPATTYSLYLKAYSSMGPSQQSNTVVATTLGGVPTPPTYFTKVLNSSAVHVLWELPGKAGQVEGFRLSYRRVPQPEYQEPIQLRCDVNTHVISDLEPGAVYEVKLVAYNGNGESDCSKRLVSLAEQRGSSLCQCRDAEASLGSVVVGIHIGTACIIFCVLFLIFGYRRSLLCSKGTQDSWPVPRIHNRPNSIPKDGTNQSEAQVLYSETEKCKVSETNVVDVSLSKTEDPIDPPLVCVCGSLMLRMRTSQCKNCLSGKSLCSFCC